MKRKSNENVQVWFTMPEIECMADLIRGSTKRVDVLYERRKQRILEKIETCLEEYLNTPIKRGVTK